MEEVRHRIRKAEDGTVKIKQVLAMAKQTGNRGGEEEVKFVCNQLLSLNNQLSSLQEKDNILLQNQAPTDSNP